MTEKPNIYRFATKEFALDATLAYLLEFAHPRYQDSHSCLNQLSKALLDVLIGTNRKGMEKSNISSLVVRTQVSLSDSNQRNRIDVLVLVNYTNQYRLALLIENKIGDHGDSEAVSKQIERYKNAARAKYQEYDIVPVYVNIGNISKWKLPCEEKCGRLLRKDILGVLDKFESACNTIVYEFREYLQELEDRTNSFRHLPPCKWKEHLPLCKWKEDLRFQGYYLELERQMDKDIAKWKIGDFGYVHNQQGGFVCFTFAWEEVIRKNAHQNKYQIDVYLQMENATRLTLRVGRWHDPSVKAPHDHGVKAPLMYLVLKELQNSTDACRAERVSIEKAGRFGGGESGAVAVFTFNKRGYMALDKNGIIDIDRTMKRLDCVQNIVVEVAKRLRSIDQKVARVAEIPDLSSVPAEFENII